MRLEFHSPSSLYHVIDDVIEGEITLKDIFNYLSLMTSFCEEFFVIYSLIRRGGRTEGSVV